jgi:hexosaminidase
MRLTVISSRHRLSSISTLALALSLSLLLSDHGAHALWPQPRSLQTGATPLRLSPTFTITLDGIPNAPLDLLAAAQRTYAHLFADKLAPLDPTRGAANVSAYDVAQAVELPGLVLSLEGDSDDGPESAVKSISEEACVSVGERVEGYNLSVPVDGSPAMLSAASTLGLFRGLTTFAQLWFYYEGSLGDYYGSGYGESQSFVYLLTAPVMIEDSPAYVRRRGC